MFRSEGPSSDDHLYEYKIEKVQWSKVKKNWMGSRIVLHWN
jgi:hypothetical protein